MSLFRQTFFLISHLVSWLTKYKVSSRHFLLPLEREKKVGPEENCLLIRFRDNIPGARSSKWPEIQVISLYIRGLLAKINYACP